MKTKKFFPAVLASAIALISLSVAASEAEFQIIHSDGVRPRRLPKNAGELNALFEAQLGQGRIGLMRVKLTSGPLDLSTVLRLGMEPESIWVLQGALEVSSTSGEKGSFHLAPEDALYRPSRNSLISLYGPRPQPAQFLLWTYESGTAGSVPPAVPVFRPASSAKARSMADGKGTVKILVDPQAAAQARASLELLAFKRGAKVPEHRHPSEAEIVFVTKGTGTLRVSDKAMVVSRGDLVYIPANTAHSFVTTAREGFHAVQSYAPPGPEQRFKTGLQ
jgi:quercetin dioxygenase-like cupin family protein